MTDLDRRSEEELEKIEDKNLANQEEDKLGENIEELLTPEFLQNHSKVKNVEELYDKLNIHLQEDFERRNVEDMNEVVREYTEYETLEELIDAAKEESK